ncbi:MAG: DUF4041 domain-containing protein [Absicoccus sp.]|uniref:DUF4041 domain-containing protein n=1 Tax=Absicoccus sp. TaxID=2718527 RepID=UPI002A75EA63|nr:DUF4041 domain-containing protein [Absicoccus sp.]MDY3036029.1 DUF4041 domain-containing protein [Absicoccus sp.]
MGLFNKKELTRIQELEQENQDKRAKIEKLEEENKSIKNMLDSFDGREAFEIKQETKKMIEALAKSREELNIINQEIKDRSNKLGVIEDLEKLDDKLSQQKNELSAINAQIEDAKSNLFDINSDVELQDFGIYTPKYNCMDSNEYSEKIKICRKKQKFMISNKSALSFFDGWTLDGSKTKGRAMNNDNMKMVLRAFNNECDSIIDKVKFNNIDKISKQIDKAADAIDKLNKRNRIAITSKYKQLKHEELDLVYEYRRKKQEEKEKLREQRAEERELAKLQKEIEEQRKRVEKEQMQYTKAKEQYLVQLSKCSREEKDGLIAKIKDIDVHLNEVDKNLKDIDYREANKRAGYVYIISNIGSFGKDIYKIGMTRRLDPQDRVDELGDASVPFTFDVHAMIFSDDAPTLETNLHKEFDNKKVNMVNSRKEFFHVTLEEIKEAVKKYNENIIEIKDTPDAEQYRETLLIRKQLDI